MNKTNSDATKNARKKLRRYVAAATALLVVALFLALVTHKPAEFFIRYSLGKIFDAHIEVAVTQKFGILHIERLTLSDKNAPPSTPPAVLIEDLRIDYRFLPANDRHIATLSASTLAFTLHSDNSGNTNHQFLIDFLTAPASDIDPMRILPEETILENISLNIQTPESALALDGLKAQATIAAQDNISIEITADTQLTWRMQGLVPTSNVSAGHVNISLDLNEGNLEGKGEIAFPGLVSFNGSVDATVADQLQSLKSNITDASLQGPIWGELLGTFLGFPISFERFTLSDTTLELENFQQSDSTFGGHVQADCNALTIGTRTAPWYNGDLAIKIDGTIQEESFLTLTVLPHNGQTLLATVQGEVGDLDLSLILHEWTREDITALTPASMKWLLDELPTLETLSAQVNATWNEDGYTLDGQVTPTLDNTQFKADLEAKGTLFSNSESLFDGTVNIVQQPLRTQLNDRPPEGSLAIHALISSTEAINLEIRPDRLDAGKWFHAWTGNPLPESANAILAGPLTITANQDQPYEFTFNVAASNVRYGEKSLAPGDALMLSGRGKVDRSSSAAEGEFLEVKLSNVNYLRLDNWSFDSASAALTTQLTGTLDLATVAPFFGLDQWWGELNIAARITTDDAGHTQIPLVVTAESLGYGDLATPYGDALEVDGNFVLDTQSQTLTADRVTITVGDGTRLALDDLEARSSSETDSASIAIATLKFSTDLRPLISNGYLLESQGIATIAAADLLYSTTTGLHGQMDFTLDAPSLVLPDNLAVFTDALLEGHVTDLSRWQAEAAVQSSEMFAAGIRLENFHGTLKLEDGLLESRDFSARLLEGTFSGAIAINLEEEEMPIHAEINLDAIDLARFTEEFELSTVKLTGIADAALTVDFDSEGISDYDVSVTARRDFTLNRDLILSLAENMTGVPILGKSILRAIGEADQRPFGRAELSLRHQDGRIKIEGRLQDIDKEIKEKLNIPITIDIAGDINDLIRFVQQQQNQRVQKSIFDTNNR